MQSGRVTALIAEDEPLLRKQLKARLAQAWPELVVVAEAENGAEAVVLASEFKPDVAFLDIRMPVKDGIAVAEAIGDQCHIVFVTAYDEYAVTAFEQGAVDYLLKPVTVERSDVCVVPAAGFCLSTVSGTPAEYATGFGRLRDPDFAGSGETLTRTQSCVPW